MELDMKNTQECAREEREAGASQEEKVTSIKASAAALLPEVTSTAATSYRHCCQESAALLLGLTSTAARSYQHCCHESPALLSGITSTAGPTKTGLRA